MSGKLKQNHIKEDLEGLQESKVHFPEEKEFNEIQCHMCSGIFNNGESLRIHVRKSYKFCANCSNLFFNENDLKMHKKKCNICEQCGKEKHNGNCIKQSNEGNKWKKKKG